ncbi:hypothetical protein PVAP13_4KG136805 [Panicum virgatum]|uniref:Uncharacterized protein n=1 Tax=Panicum virgatum TaxID=38727 RepID=A0A8T0TH53_PANVG|nr:hypothetical protein PVAP13_4KG136805 [Panicum virgatum]
MGALERRPASRGAPGRRRGGAARRRADQAENTPCRRGSGQAVGWCAGGGAGPAVEEARAGTRRAEARDARRRMEAQAGPRPSGSRRRTGQERRGLRRRGSPAGRWSRGAAEQSAAARGPARAGVQQSTCCEGPAAAWRSRGAGLGPCLGARRHGARDAEARAPPGRAEAPVRAEARVGERRGRGRRREVELLFAGRRWLLTGGSPVARRQR